MRATFICLWAILLPILAFGDGGTILAMKEDAHLKITIFAEAVPPRVGVMDLSILVQDASSQQAILDANVRLSLKKLSVLTPENSWLASYCKIIGSKILTATRDQAHNKMLYGVALPLPEAGKWELTVEVKRENKVTSMTLPLEVAAAQNPFAAWWPFLIMVPLVIGLYTWRAALIRRHRPR